MGPAQVDVLPALCVFEVSLCNRGPMFESLGAQVVFLLSLQESEVVCFSIHEVVSNGENISKVTMCVDHDGNDVQHWIRASGWDHPAAEETGRHTCRWSSIEAVRHTRVAGLSRPWNGFLRVDKRRKLWAASPVDQDRLVEELCLGAVPVVQAVVNAHGIVMVVLVTGVSE